MFPFFKQPDQMDCGPCCLRMVAKYYGRNFKLQTLRELSEINKEGVSPEPGASLKCCQERKGDSCTAIPPTNHLPPPHHLPNQTI